MAKVRVDVQGKAVKAHPLAKPDPERRDLVLGHRAVRQARLFGTPDPDADPVLTSFAPHVHRFKRADHRLFQRGDIGADILAATLQVEHHIGDPLARAVIGVFAAASRRKDREAVRLDEVG